MQKIAQTMRGEYLLVALAASYFYEKFSLFSANFISYTLHVNNLIRLWFHASLRDSIFRRDIGKVRKPISTIPLMVRDSANKTCAL